MLSYQWAYLCCMEGGRGAELGPVHIQKPFLTQV
jgi:hypothetical protein